MSKMSELSAMIDNLISCGETLAETGRALKEFYSGTEEAAPVKPEKKTKKQEPAPAETPAEKQYSKEEVRGILAKKANEAEGRFKADVKAIVQKYGNGGSLTNVDPKDYAALVTEVEGLTDAYRSNSGRLKYINRYSDNNKSGRLTLNTTYDEDTI